MKIDLNYKYHHSDNVKPTLVFLHGLGGNLHAWDNITKILKKKYSILQIDLRGHGKSKRPAKVDEYKIDCFADDINLLINKLKINKFIIIGHCYGGVIASVYQYKYKKALSVIMIGSTHKAPKRMNLLLPFMFIAKHFVLNYLPANTNDSRIDFSRFIGSGDYNLYRILSDIKNTSVKSYTATFSQFNNYNGENILRSIKVPVLIISGDKDMVFTPNYAHRINELVKKTTLIRLPHANHILVLNNSKEIADIIDNYVLNKILPKK